MRPRRTVVDGVACHLAKAHSNSGLYSPVARYLVSSWAVADSVSVNL